MSVAFHLCAGDLRLYEMRDLGISFGLFSGRGAVWGSAGLVFVSTNAPHSIGGAFGGRCLCREAILWATCLALMSVWAVCIANGLYVTNFRGRP